MNRKPIFISIPLSHLPVVITFIKRIIIDSYKLRDRMWREDGALVASAARSAAGRPVP